MYQSSRNQLTYLLSKSTGEFLYEENIVKYTLKQNFLFIRVSLHIADVH